MSEPQHPYGNDTNPGRAAPGGAPSPVQSVPPAPDTVAAAGARLAQLREARGWTVEDVSARLKVAVPKLRALEAGELGQLPDTTFALGVVRSYAKMLGADPAPFTQALRRERGVPQPDLSMPASSGADLPRGRVSLTLGGSGATRRRSWLWGVAAVIVAVIALGMWHTNSGESSAWFARLKALAGGAVGAGAASSATVAVGQTAGTEAPAARVGDQAAAPNDGAAGTGAQAAGATVQPGAEVPPPGNAGAAAGANAAPAPGAAANTPPGAAASTAAANAATNGVISGATGGATSGAAASAPVVATTVQGASAANGAAAPGGSTFAISVTQDSWVGVRQADGKELFSGLLHGGDTRQVSGVEPLRITVGNKAGIGSMTIDGRPVDAAKYASARGNVARFVLP